MTWTATERTIGTVLSTEITDDESPAARRHICTISVSADNPAAIEEMRARARLICQAKAMRDWIKRIEPNIGWRSQRGDDPDIYFCEFCAESHADSRLIPHHNECLVYKARAIIAATEYDTVDRADIGHTAQEPGDE